MTGESPLRQMSDDAGRLESQIASDDLVDRLKSGEEGALDELFTNLFEDLTRTARRFLDPGTRQQSKLQTGDLVNSGCRRILAAGIENWINTRHVYRLACSAMRCALVDHIRRRQVRPEASIDYTAEILAPEKAREVVALDEALRELEEISPDSVRLIELRYFGGFGMAECAELLNLPKRTIERQWTTARHWLRGFID